MLDIIVGRDETLKFIFRSPWSGKARTRKAELSLFILISQLEVVFVVVAK